MAEQYISISRGGDSANIHATLHTPSATTKAYALFFHYFPALESQAERKIIKKLIIQGIAVLSVEVGIQDNVENHNPLTLKDLHLVYKYIKENYYNPQIFITHGLTSLLLAKLLEFADNPLAVISIATPSNVKDIQISEKDLFPNKTTRLNICKKSIIFDDSIVYYIRNITGIKELLNSIHTPKLLLHGVDDSIYSYESINSLFNSLNGIKSFFSIPKGNHQLNFEQPATFAASIIAEWVYSYLPTNNNKNHIADSNLDVTSVYETGKKTYQLNCHMGKHIIISDLPNSKNGNDTGPSPIQLLHAALGTSTAIAMRAYAESENLPLKSISISIRQEKNIHSAYSQIPDSEHIILEVSLFGDIDSIQQSTLIKVAEKSSINKALNHKLIIRSRIA